MIKPSFGEDEVAAVLAKHPGLALKRDGSVEGSLEIHAIYEGHEIRDCFQVRFTKKNPVSDRLPALFEIGGRTEAIARKWSLPDARGLHRNPQGNACVCVKQEELERFPEGSDLGFFIDSLCRDYLYGLSYFDAHGYWPWDEHSHGSLGILEYYADARQPLTVASVEEILPSIAIDANWKNYHKQLRNPTGQRACLCGSDKPFQSCHPLAWQGLVYLAAEMERLGIDKRGAFDRARSQISSRFENAP